MIQSRRYATGIFLSALAFTLSAGGQALAERAYLDDANTRDPQNGSFRAINQHGFPRVLVHETKSSVSNAAYGKYDFIDTHGNGFDTVKAVQQNVSSETQVLRHISGRAYQSYTTNNCNISNGIAFESTTAASQGGPQTAGCGIYAGHWLYRAGTTLRQNVGNSTTTIPVSNAARIASGRYVVIYDAPVGSFKNAEHARVTSVNRSANTVTVQRAYKSSARSHSAGAVIAQHVLGQGNDARLWAFNLSTQSPRDANGKTFGQFYADWLGSNIDRYKNGQRSGANVAGILLDADFFFELPGYETDANNDLKIDNGISSSGTNWLGDGLNEFYQRILQRLPSKVLLTGVHDARGYRYAQGIQGENWLDYGNGDFDPRPKYEQIDSLFAGYLFNMSERTNGPAIVHNLTKTPTKQYPGKSGSAASSNAPFRLGLAMTLMEDGYYGTHSAHEPDAWWDEYAVDVRAGSPDFGKAIQKSDVNAVLNHKGWLGQPLGSFERIYDDAAFAPQKNRLANGSFDSNVGQWRTDNVSISREQSSQWEGSGAMRVSPMQQFKSSLSGATVKSEQISVTGGKTYTVAFAARASANRDIRLSFGNARDKLPIGTKWRRYVVELTPTKGGNSAVRFAVGQESTQFWIDSVYLFDGDANVFRREFENGLVLANATSKSKTINVGSGFRRISGNQDRAVNNGKSVSSSVTLPPHDGLLLVREEGSSSEPPPPPPPSSGGGSRIGDYVWADSDADGIQDSNESGVPGVTVKLRQCDGGVIQTTSTAGNGRYEFTDLAVGRYQVEFVKPSGATFSPIRVNGGGPDNSDANESTGRSFCVIIKSDGQSMTGVDAGLVVSGGSVGGGGAILGDYVWLDSDGDGIQDSSESGAPGVTVKLRSCNGLLIRSVTTNGGGEYRFDGLTAGDYMLQFVPPDGASISPARRGNARDRDSNPSANGMTGCRSLSGNDERHWLDAGIVN